jgi:hypothetical protein
VHVERNAATGLKVPSATRWSSRLSLARLTSGAPLGY